MSQQIRYMSTVIVFLVGLAAASVASGGAVSSVVTPQGYFTPQRLEVQQQLEGAVLGIPKISSLRAHHDLLSSAPHQAGTPGDAELIEWLVDSYSRLGLPVERQVLTLYLPRPVVDEVEILSPVRLMLPVQEPPIPSDHYSSHPSLGPAWAAYSGSGEVAGQVVYANYGTRGDFEELEAAGIRLQGRIVVARYGKIFRGYKAKNAEESGAAGLILYTDPADTGWGQGISYPEGGWLNADSIQRGSLLTLPYPGDPLTPGAPAVSGTPRLSPADLDLPSIPVQPMGWGAAQEILSRMSGPAVPRAWQGGLPFAYRLTGGPELLVRVRVEQDREMIETSNVVATLPGTRFPDQFIILGCHHDAWSFGASDPNAGSIVLYEVARAFMELARRGIRTQRTLVFANWAAEEMGIQGSTEWVEANRESLAQGGVAYINLDGAALGLDFGAAVSPSLGPLLEDVLAEVAQPGAQPGTSVLEAWRAAEDGDRRFGALGGGSDHVAFYTHLGIPSMSISAGGSPGSAYHTNYDTLDWYRHTVGDDYEGALMLTQIVAVLAARLANADVIPLSPAAYADDFRLHLEEIDVLAGKANFSLNLDGLRAAIDDFASAGDLSGVSRATANGTLSPASANGISWEILQLERLWLENSGLPERPWYKSLYAAPDPETGYSPWLLPLLRKAVEDRDPSLARSAITSYERIFRLLRERVRTLDRLAVPLANEGDTR
ncbi:MAG: M28 family peptidase [Thermoanaerobaculia bacterium]|nr:M28 family peptidase [Thermoanaerobaculia bacterium]